MVVLLHIELITCRLPPWRCRVYYFSCKPRTEHNPLKNGILMIRLDLVPWLETTAAVGMNQPVRGAPIPPHGEVQTRSGQFSRRACLARPCSRATPTSGWKPNGATRVVAQGLHKRLRQHHPKTDILILL